MNALVALFEEDIEMQDSIEDIGDLDNTEDLIIRSMEDRSSEEDSVGLFDNEEQVNDDGLTADEENEANALMMDQLDDELDIDEEDEDLLDMDF